MISTRTVAVVSGEHFLGYQKTPPFRPDDAYPEMRGRVAVENRSNLTYRLFRQLMRELTMDVTNFGTRHWNPLGEIILPGQRVLIKPNLVRHIHLGGGDYQAVVTHGSLIRCVLDYASLALKGRGEIVVGDAPIQSADFGKILGRTGLQEVCNEVTKTWQIPVKLVDFRLSSVRLDDNHRVINSSTLKGDTAGYFAVNLGKQSLLFPLNDHSEKFRVTNYDSGEMQKHHNLSKHEYLIPHTALNADVVINLPKLKTHRKVGLTAALKNVVGINGHKDWLPHHRCGSIKEGGDEYLNPSFLKRIQTKLSEKIDKDPFLSKNKSRRLGIRVVDSLINHFALDTYTEGSWYGNNTLWRTVLDLNRLLIYADRNGIMTNSPQRKCFTIVDAVVAGEGEGPMEPDPRKCGLLVAGVNPVAVDAVLATIIGFNYKLIPLIVNAFKLNNWPLVNFDSDEIEINASDARWANLVVGHPKSAFNFKPPMGWKGHIEINERLKAK